MNNKLLKRLLESFILALLGVFMFQLLLSGNINRYMNPRNIPWIWFGAIALVLLAFANILFTQMFEREADKHLRNKVGLSKYAFFFIPVISSLFMNGFTLDASILANKGISVSRNTTIQTLQVTKGSNKLTEEELVAKLGNIENVTDTGDILMITPELFNYEFLSLNEKDPELIGKRIQISGFIHYDKSFAEGEFMISRYAMVCCNVDMQVTGYICKVADGVDTTPLTNGAWLHAKGYIELSTWKDVPVINIVVDSYTIMPAPADPQSGYIYPY